MATATADAAAHAYLFQQDGEGGGESYAEVLDRTFLEEGAEIELPILPLHGVVLFPGEALPLRSFRQEQLRLLRQLHAGEFAHQHVGVVNVRAATGARGRLPVANVGTTVELVKI